MGLIMFRITASIFTLCSVLTSALCCDWLTHYNDLRNSSLVLVQDMGGAFTDQRTSVPFPYKLYERTKEREENSQLLFIRDSLKQIYDLYRYNNMSAAGWDPVKTADFLETINRQIEELSHCVDSTQTERTNKRLRRYYTELKSRTLLHPGGRDGWELLRKETEQHLVQLDLLGNRLRATSRGRHAASRHLNFH